MSSVPTKLTAVSDWLPSVFSMLHMSPPMLVLLVMFMPPDVPICLFFILDVKSLSVRAQWEHEREGGVEEEEEDKDEEEEEVE